MQILDDVVHYVYRLYADGALVYVGRSVTPKVRKTIFERKRSLNTSMKVFGPYTFAEAAAKEIRDIKRLRPPYNRRVASSACRLGKSNTEFHNAAISERLKGRPKSQQHRANLWKNRGPLSDNPKNVRRRKSL